MLCKRRLRLVLGTDQVNRTQVNPERKLAVRGFAHSGFGHLLEVDCRLSAPGEQFEIIFKKGGTFDTVDS